MDPSVDKNLIIWVFIFKSVKKLAKKMRFITITTDIFFLFKYKFVFHFNVTGMSQLGQ